MWYIFAFAILCLANPVSAIGASVSVAEFGAFADDGKDDTLGVSEAIRHCLTSGAATLQFGPGKYTFAAGADKAHPQVSFIIEEAKDLEIRGDRTELEFSGRTSCFIFSRCSGIKVSGLTVDWKRPPFSVGKIIDSQDKHFDVAVWKQYPVSGGEPVGALMDYDPVTRIPAKRAIDIYYGVESTELVAPQVLRVHLKNPGRLSVGNLVVLRHEVYGYNGFNFDRCKDVQIEDVNVYCCPGMGLIGVVTENISVKRFNVMPRPGSGNLMSATADAMHFGGCKGKIEIEDCQFAAMGDDAINIKSGLYLSVREIKDRRTLRVQHNLKMVDLPDPGDVVELSHVDTLISYGTAMIESAKADGGEGMMEVRLTEDLPDGVQVGDVLGNATRTPKVRIYDCHVRGNRARGFLLQTRDVLVDRCTFKNITSGGVWVMTEVVYFFESIGTRNVLVRNCEFDDCNYGGPMGEGVLSVQAYLAEFAYPEVPGVHRNIRLENNTVRGTDNCAIFVTGADNISIKGNTVVDVSRQPTRPFGSSAIYVTGSRDVTIEDNSVIAEEQGAGFKQALELGPGVEIATLKVTGNQGF